MIVRTNCIKYSFECANEQYGVEEDGLPGDDSESKVIIAKIGLSLTREHFQLLQQDVNPLDESKNHGIELYERILHYCMTIPRYLQLYTK